MESLVVPGLYRMPHGAPTSRERAGHQSIRSQELHDAAVYWLGLTILANIIRGLFDVCDTIAVSGIWGSSLFGH